MAWQAIPGVGADDPIVIEWGNAVANDINAELIRRDGTIAMTGRLVLPISAPTLDGHAIYNKYLVDNYSPKADATMTGQVNVNGSLNEVMQFRSQATTAGSPNNQPAIGFYSNNMATRYGYVSGTSPVLIVNSLTGDVRLLAAQDVLLDATAGAIRASSLIRAADRVYATGSSRFFGTSTILAGGSSAVHLDLYAGATNVDTIGARNGYLGYPGNSQLTLENESASGSIFLTTPAAIVLTVASAERARMSGSTWLVGKNVTTLATQGHATFADGNYQTTRTGGAVGNSANIQTNRTGSVAGELFIEFLRDGTRVGRIEQTGTSGAQIVSGSDYRMKTIVGPIDDAVERVKGLKPYRVTWNGDPSRGETDAFIAHEVEPFVPEAVSGEKDAVTGPPETENDPPQAATRRR